MFTADGAGPGALWDFSGTFHGAARPSALRMPARTPTQDRDLLPSPAYASRPSRRLSLISPSLCAASGVHSLSCPSDRKASSIAPSFAEDSAPARSIRSSRVTVVSYVHGAKPGRGNAKRSTPSKGNPSPAPTATSTSRPLMSTPAGATTCIAWKPYDSSHEQQYDRPLFIELDPPDLTALHVSSKHQAAGRPGLPPCRVPVVPRIRRFRASAASVGRVGCCGADVQVPGGREPGRLAARTLSSANPHLFVTRQEAWFPAPWRSSSRSSCPSAPPSSVQFATDSRARGAIPRARACADVQLPISAELASGEDRLTAMCPIRALSPAFPASATTMAKLNRVPSRHPASWASIR